ncbi:hypothetical protein [Nocardia aurantiaca]|uniref:Uncharacterized protein n=1 Tax=Nocardia aurantiaca TaxID=2675850 RepID=A0A6I3L3H6_9NOCA|nr:hypothetical protein [Nocardia aurantiaca]MTE15194.1 hypothetical protein [Nocardia aurantiaca]
MTAATLPQPSPHDWLETRASEGGVITRVQDAVRALPAPTLPRDTVRAATVSDLASTHVVDSCTLAVVVHRDRHIQPIAAMITRHLPGLTVTVVRSAITISIA